MSMVERGFKLAAAKAAPAMCAGQSQRVSMSVAQAREVAHLAVLAGDGTDTPLEVIRAGSAIVFANKQLVVRVTDVSVPVGEAALHLHLAAYLQAHGVLAAIPALPEPVVVGEYAASVWLREIVVEGAPSPESIGRLLAATHQLHAPAWLPRFDALAVTRRRLESFPANPLVLGTELELLQTSLRLAEAALGHYLRAKSQIVHGDIPGNLMTTARGSVLIDFENSGRGDPTWDLTRLLHGPSRFARDPSTVELILDAYVAAGASGD